MPPVPPVPVCLSCNLNEMVECRPQQQSLKYLVQIPSIVSTPVPKAVPAVVRVVCNDVHVVENGLFTCSVYLPDVSLK